ncbi:MAG: LPS assembly lipoprotein LptE [Nitrospirota bacterium]
MKKLFCIFLLLTLPACGYQLARTGTVTGKGAGKYRVSIPMFVNDSESPLVEKDVTEALKEEVALDGRWVLTDGGDEDILVKGRVVKIEFAPLSFDPNDRVLEYRLKMHLDVKVSDIKSGKVLWKEDDFVSYADYRVTVDVTKSKIRREEAIKYASQNFAQEFIIRVLDIF